jgi:hypothetical protein
MLTKTINCKCLELDDDLIQQGYTCYNCYEEDNE